MIRKNWEVQHNGHTIRVENRVLSERLYIDGQLVDEKKYSITGSKLRGTITSPGGPGEDVVAVIYASLWKVECAIVAGKDLSTQPIS